MIAGTNSVGPSDTTNDQNCLGLYVQKGHQEKVAGGIGLRPDDLVHL